MFINYSHPQESHRGVPQYHAGFGGHPGMPTCGGLLTSPGEGRHTELCACQANAQMPLWSSMQRRHQICVMRPWRPRSFTPSRVLLAVRCHCAGYLVLRSRLSPLKELAVRMQDVFRLIHGTSIHQRMRYEPESCDPSPHPSRRCSMDYGFPLNASVGLLATQLMS